MVAVVLIGFIASTIYYIVVMSPSWIFPSRAEPSYEVSEPSWGTLISELKPSWQCQQNIAILFSQFFSQVFIIRFCLHIYQFRDHLLANKVFFDAYLFYIIMKINKKNSSSTENWILAHFRPIFGSFLVDFASELKWKRSRAEPSWKSFSSSYGSSQLGSGSSLLSTQ